VAAGASGTGFAAAGGAVGSAAGEEGGLMGATTAGDGPPSTVGVSGGVAEEPEGALSPRAGATGVSLSGGATLALSSPALSSTAGGGLPVLPVLPQAPSTAAIAANRPNICALLDIEFSSHSRPRVAAGTLRKSEVDLSHETCSICK
jgi:hypothetical protein